MIFNVSGSVKKSDFFYIDGQIYLTIADVPSGTLFEYRNSFYLKTSYLHFDGLPYCFAMATGEMLDNFDSQTKVKLVTGTIEINGFLI